MSRRWIELVDALRALVPLPLLILLLLLAAGLVGVLLYFFPRWIPRRWPRLRWPRLRWRLPRWRWHLPRWRWHFPRLHWPRWRWPRLPRWAGWADFWRWLRRVGFRRRRKPEAPQPPAEPEPSEEALPDRTVEAFVSLADRLAAQGRFAEAVRERLRAIVRDLVDRRIIEHHPGWTVTELAHAAANARPAVDAPLGEAAAIFSDIWYGQRPATLTHDARMRALTEQVRAAIATRVGAAA